MKFMRIPLLYCQAQKHFYCQTKKSFSVSSTMRKAPGVGGKSDKSLNQDFVDFLMELSNYEKNVNRNTFKGNAYKKVKILIFEFVVTKLSFLTFDIIKLSYSLNSFKLIQAAGVVAKLDYRISSGEEAKKLDGIGQRISEKIDEFLKTGKLNKLEKVCNIKSRQISYFIDFFWFKANYR